MVAPTGVLSLRGAQRRGNLRRGAQRVGDCFAPLAMTGNASQHQREETRRWRMRRGSSVPSPERAHRATQAMVAPATQALLNNPFDLAFDPGGNLCFSDTYNHCIRRIDARTGIITTIAGTGERGFAGDGGPATQARMNAAVRHRHRPHGQHLRGGSAERARATDRRRHRRHHHAGGRRLGQVQRRRRAVGARGTGRAERPRTGSRPSSPVHRGCRRSPGARDRPRLRQSSPRSPAPATGDTPEMAVPPRPPMSSAPARSRWHRTTRSTSWSGRAAACAAYTTASSKPSPAPARAATRETGTMRATRCSTHRRKWRVDPAGNIFIVDTENHVIRLIDAQTLDRHHHCRQWQARSRRPGATARCCRRTGWRGLHRRFREPPRAQAGAAALAAGFPS